MAVVTTLHPLLVISITDHYERVRNVSPAAPGLSAEDAEDIQKRQELAGLPIAGLLFGSESDIVNSLEVLLKKNVAGFWEFDQATLKSWIEDVGAFAGFARRRKFAPFLLHCPTPAPPPHCPQWPRCTPRKNQLAGTWCTPTR